MAIRAGIPPLAWSVYTIMATPTEGILGISVSGNTFSIAAGTFSTLVDETTTYVYGSNLGLTASTVPIYSNDLLRAVIDPGSSNTPQDVANASTNGYNRVLHYIYNICRSRWKKLCEGNRKEGR